MFGQIAKSWFKVGGETIALAASVPNFFRKFQDSFRQVKLPFGEYCDFHEFEYTF